MISNKIEENINKRRVDEGLNIFLSRYIKTPTKIFNNRYEYNLNEYLWFNNTRKIYIETLLKYEFYIKEKDLYEAYSLFCRCKNIEKVHIKLFVDILRNKFLCDSELMFDPNNNDDLVMYIVGIRYTVEDY